MWTCVRQHHIISILEDGVYEKNITLARTSIDFFPVATEKQKHLGARFHRSGMDLSRASLTLPKKIKKPAHDTISLIDSGSSMESLSGAGLFGSKQLSSSMLNINESGGNYFASDIWEGR